MKSKVQRWGNSLAVRIPKRLAVACGVVAGTEVDVWVRGGEIVLAPRVRRRYCLEDLIRGITPRNRHAEADSGPSQGAEAW